MGVLQGENAVKNSYKKKNTVLFFLLVVSLIWNLIFKLTSVSVEMAILIYSNSITNMLVDMYWGGIPG